MTDDEWNALLATAQPVRAANIGGATIGTAWYFPYRVALYKGGPLLDLSDCTAVAAVYSNRSGGSQIIALTPALGDGTAEPNLLLTATTADTSGISPTTQEAWACHLVRGTEKVQLWRTAESPFPLGSES